MRFWPLMFVLLVGCTDDAHPELECPAEVTEPAACPEGSAVLDYGAGLFTCGQAKPYATVTCELAACSGTYETDGVRVWCAP